MTCDDHLEATFVLESVRRALDSTTAAATTETVTQGKHRGPEELDWSRVLAIAQRNAVEPLVYEAVESTSDDIPEWVRDELAAAYRTNAKRNLGMAGALHEIIQAFRERDVRALPFKGPVLAEVGYDDLNRRTFLDLDILVHPSDREQAGEIVRELGYERTRPVNPQVRESPLFEQSFTEYEYHRPNDDVSIELRWEFTMSHLMSVETLWERRSEQSVTGKVVPTLSPADRLLVEAAHATKHCCRRLAWVADVAVTASSIDDWDTVLDTISDLQCGQWVTVSVQLAEELFDASVPESFWMAPTVPANRSLAEGMHNTWLQNPIDTTSLLDEFWFRTRLQPPSDLAREVIDVVFRPRPIDYESFPLPTSLHPLYYIFRPLRLAYSLPYYRRSSPE